MSAITYKVNRYACTKTPLVAGLNSIEVVKQFTWFQ